MYALKPSVRRNAHPPGNHHHPRELQYFFLFNQLHHIVTAARSCMAIVAQPIPDLRKTGLIG